MDDLIRKIVHCENISKCYQSENREHPCCKVVWAQRDLAINENDFQVPEPWNGRITTAPILFVSSNPSINVEEEYPTRSWPEEKIADFFTNRFNGRWVKDNRGLLKSGEYAKKSTSFWNGIGKQAERLLRRKPKIGIDFAVTEIVRCKSKHDTIVDEACIRECSNLYFEKTLLLSGAKVVVILGRARKFMQVKYKNDLVSVTEHIYSLAVGGRKMYVIFTGHPAGREVRNLDKILFPRELDFLNRVLEPERS